MKAMHMNGSCAYCALAILLEEYNIDVEDIDIIINIKLDSMFSYDKENDLYLSGASLQSKPYFDLYLRQHNLEFIEKKISKNELTKILDINKKIMFGIKNENGKHAVVFDKKEDDRYIFINPKGTNSNEPDYLFFTKNELLLVLPDYLYYGYICIMNKANSLFTNNSLYHFENYKKDLLSFCESKISSNELLTLRDKLLRPLLIDLHNIYALTNEPLSREIKTLLNDFLKLFKLENTFIIKNKINYDNLLLVLLKVEVAIRGHLYT